MSSNEKITKVSEEVHCPRCNHVMKLFNRKRKCKGETREYLTYRCYHRGCRTERSARKRTEPDGALLEIASTCTALPQSDPIPLQRKCQPDVAVSNRSISEGSLFYIPAKITTQQMKIMQVLTFNLLGGVIKPQETALRPMFAHVDMSPEELDRHLQTEEGRKV
ncbi:hypothetical protein KIN20_037077 [Parelaphostrongylus tenuis]|uniref:Uncharacterized protein n=1 Tax=Parelaphostrongylus tenuis TaxID=148309 RepID=A0AAD5WM58_PARTN|nr:hypothetical protein KIN20_037077 [Parelaphostrongylus tenuis]